ncbi:MAG: RagB/SusD family nutrient uptake outer membrane protein [Gemmatimonadota bacterium]|nr:RagB/SusD family nutrient uptake outer membrane protein [Gemmatimonadota bacterium]MDH3367398.1 RagB/SusD family nutrient uptake outer membrane protein [Gemmatimonadota bacterium]MDH3477755.1 RagB/SusD family nutrient uptake outer membrane protein [Gemmatimonadota bacterium]MDH5548521.1 RagB/SusD family nutrient uptake outer membrane protein [Gemmatimonadota bacterium]
MMKALYRSRLLSGTAFLILVTGATYACGDFLEGAPQGALDEQTLANQAGVEGTLIAAYRVLDWNNGVGGDWGTAASNWVWGDVTSDDSYKGSEASDQPNVTDLELYNWTTGQAESYLNDKWRGSYEGVVRANATIKLLNAVVENNPAEISQANQERIRGEALFLRAHFHFEAWRMWANIPYYTEDDTDFRKSNVGVDPVASILSDLDQAIQLLPATQNDVGRATQWTAKAYKGRVQVYSGDYAGAITTLGDVRTSGPYALEQDFSRVWTGFQQYSNGPETILAYQASANDGEPDGNNANYGERLNFPHSGSPFGCCGFHQPTQNLVNFFAVDAVTGLPLALTDPNWNARDANLDATASAAMALDPRLDWTVGRDGVPYKDWGAHAPGWIRAPAYGGPYSAKKSAYESASGAVSNVGWVNTQLSSMNIHIYRYADLLLLLAEANVEAGSLEEARAIVNEIRARAGMAAQGPGTSSSNIAVAINDPSTTWADYQIGLYPGPWTDQAAARTAVRYERRLELAMEGQRFFDLRRWGIAEQVLNAYLAVEGTRRPFLTAATAFTARYNLFPIPPIQIELSRVEGEDRLQQNPGW